MAEDIEKIMSEIQELQQEMETVVTPAPTKETPAEETVAAAASELEAEVTSHKGEAEWLEETYARLKDSGNPTQANKPTENIISESAITMNIAGKLVLKLKYENSGHEVVVHASEQGITLQFSDGTELKIPVRNGFARAA